MREKRGAEAIHFSSVSGLRRLVSLFAGDSSHSNLPDILPRKGFTYQQGLSSNAVGQATGHAHLDGTFSQGLRKCTHLKQQQRE